MASREELIESIRPGMKLDKAFFMKVYGYEISYPGFKETAIKTLIDAGCSKAEGYYNQIVGEYQRKRDVELKEVARDYIREYAKDREKRQKGSEEQRLREMSSQELLKLLRNSAAGVYQ